MALPDVDDFRARFPEFADTADAAIELAIEDAGDEVDEEVWMEKDYAKGVLFLAAHFLIAAGSQGETTEDGGVAVKSESLGRFSVTYDNGVQSSSSSGDDFDSTEYGKRYIRLLGRNSKRLLIV